MELYEVDYLVDYIDKKKKDEFELVRLLGYIVASSFGSTKVEYDEFLKVESNEDEEVIIPDKERIKKIAEMYKRL